MTDNFLTLLYWLLVIDALFISAPAYINWWHLRRWPDFKYFAYRALLSATAHVIEAVSLGLLILFRTPEAVVALLLAWQLGELMKVLGEWGITGSLFGMLNGVTLPPTDLPGHTIVPALGTPVTEETPTLPAGGADG